MASADSLNVEAQFTEPRTEILGIRFVELFNYPIDRLLRTDGVLHEMQRAPKSIQSGVISRLKN